MVAVVLPLGSCLDRGGRAGAATSCHVMRKMDQAWGRGSQSAQTHPWHVSAMSRRLPPNALLSGASRPKSAPKGY